MTFDELKGLLAETEQVEAGGHVWDVGDPTFEEALEVQRLFMRWGRGFEAREADPDRQLDTARAWGEAAVAAVAACVRAEGMTLRLDHEEAGTIVRRTGALYQSPLVDACLRRCGVTIPEGGEEGAAEVDPTSTS